jgi:hypothetical protein
MPRRLSAFRHWDGWNTALPTFRNRHGLYSRPLAAYGHFHGWRRGLLLLLPLGFSPLLPVPPLSCLAFRPLRKIERFRHRRKACRLHWLLQNLALSRTHVCPSSLFLCHLGPVIVCKRLGGCKLGIWRLAVDVHCGLIQDKLILLRLFPGLPLLLDLDQLLPAACGGLAFFGLAPGIGVEVRNLHLGDSGPAVGLCLLAFPKFLLGNFRGHRRNVFRDHAVIAVPNLILRALPGADRVLLLYPLELGLQGQDAVL